MVEQRKAEDIESKRKREWRKNIIGEWKKCMKEKCKIK
jgi:hypothetical protein